MRSVISCSTVFSPRITEMFWKSSRGFPSILREYTSSMLIRTLSLCFAISASLLFGQLDSNSVTVTASRSASVQPDQVLLAVYVNSGINASLDDVLAVLKTSGITITNFSGVSTNSTFGLIPVGGVPLPQPTPPTLQWAFGLPVPFSKMKDTLTALTSLQQSIIHANSGFTLSFTVQGAQ